MLVMASLLVAFVSQEAAGVPPVVREEVAEDEDFGMALDQRYHRLHADAPMECTQCHVQEAPLEVAQPSSDAAEAIGPVDRRICLGCHMNGPAPSFYEPKD